MRYTFLFLISFIFILGCSKVKDNISSPTELKIHLTGINDQNSENFHGKLVRKENWNFYLCTTCHGGNFDGGVVDKSCTNCHSLPNGPKSCNTCHGSFANVDRVAPPRDLDNKFTNDSRGVGAHNRHLYENVFGNKVECTQCHKYPSSFEAEGHIDIDNKAEIIFGNLANKRTDGVDSTLKASYTYNDQKCANTYCHGYFKNGNLTNSVKWTDAENGVKCGSCHGNSTTGNPVPGGSHPNFPGINNCAMCHIGVFKYENNTYTLLDKTKHINGIINFQ